MQVSIFMQAYEENHSEEPAYRGRWWLKEFSMLYPNPLRLIWKTYSKWTSQEIVNQELKNSVLNIT